MKLYILDTPYDYHGDSQLIVKAETVSEAASKLLEKYPKSEYMHGLDEFVHKPNLEQRLRVYDEDIYENLGCDC